MLQLKRLYNVQHSCIWEEVKNKDPNLREEKEGVIGTFCELERRSDQEEQIINEGKRSGKQQAERGEPEKQKSA